MSTVHTLSTRQRILHVGTLAVFAVSQPLFELLTRAPTFLVAHRVDAAGILLLVAVLGIGVPGVFVLTSLGARVFGSRGQAAVHLALVVALVAAIVLPPLSRLFAGQTIVPLMAAVALSGGIAWAYARLSIVRTFFTALGVAWILFPILFLADGSVCRLLRSGAIEGLGVTVGTDVPVILVVFDELPLLSLLDGDRAIDGARYPNFAALAEESTWFRNTSTVAASTNEAVPAVLTGRYPDLGLMPIRIDHPQNLFTLLEGAYEQRVFETLTQLAPPIADREIEVETPESFAVSMRTFFTDLGLVYLHVLFPDAAVQWLPPVTHTWTDFEQGSQKAPEPEDDGAATDAKRTERIREWKKIRKEKDTFKSRVAEFDRFVESINGDRGVLYFVHSALPHVPWMHTPSGRKYSLNSMQYMHGVRPNSEIWMEDEWSVLQGYQRHLLQVSLVDNLLGKLLARLESAGIRDDALLVVTADHGASFWPGHSRRDAEFAREPVDVLNVPLFIKLPGQTEGKVSDRHVRTIDILPTIADILDAQIPGPLDGNSALDGESEPFPTKRILSASGRWFEYPAELPSELPSLERKLAHFGSGRGEKGLFSIGPYPELIGRHVNGMTAARRRSGEVELSRDFVAFTRHLDDATVPAMIYGELKLDGEPSQRPVIAIAWNGVIRAVVPTLVAEGTVRPFYAMLPEAVCVPGRVELRFFQVRAGSAGPNLIPVRSTPFRFEIPRRAARFRNDMESIIQSASSRKANERPSWRSEYLRE